MDNRVEVDAGPQSPSDLDAQLARQFGSQPVVVVRDNGEARNEVNKSDYFVYDIVEGGQAILKNPSDFTDYDCTSGFGVYSNQYGPFILTAGHCFDTLNQSVHQGNALCCNLYNGLAKMGQVTSFSVGSYFDAALISTYGYGRSAQGHFHYKSNQNYEAAAYVPSNFDSMVGQAVCQTGRRWTGDSGDTHATSRCGTVNTVTYNADSLGPHYWKSNDMRGGGGDSGAATVWGTLAGWAAFGIIRGGSCVVGTDTDCSPQWGSRMDYITYIWQVSLIP